MRRRFTTVNVFSDGAIEGNPVAVVLDAEGLDSETMIEFTRWTNLSEATFVLPPTSDDADYRVRIFAPEAELAFAGHPTLGTAHAWLDAGGVPKIDGHVVQECQAGLVRLRSDEMLAFEAPPMIRDETPTEAELGRVCTVFDVAPSQIVDAHWLDNGPGWLVVMLADADAVLAVQPGQAEGPLAVGFVGFHAEPSPALIEVRAIFSDHLGVLREDPVTGSLNAAVGQWLFRTGRANGAYVAAQGQCVGRTGRVYVTDVEGSTWVGGRTTTVVDGHVEL